MKKILAMMMALVLTMSLCAFSAAEGADISGLTVTTPGGAPALALAAMAVENPGQYTTVAADTIAAAFAGKEADFIIAPLNAGAKLYKAGKSTYKLAAVVSWGNLYIAAQRDELKPEDLNGADITLFGENTINASVVLYALQANGITPAKVEYLAGAAETQALLLSGDADTFVMTAEPAVTAAKMKDETISSVPVNDLYKEVTGFDGFTQAGLFVREKTAAENPELIKEGLEKIQASVEMCEKDPAAVAKNVVAMEILPKEPVALKALPGCSIRWMTAGEAREQIETTAGIDLKQFGGELPADDFYFSAD